MSSSEEIKEAFEAGYEAAQRVEFDKNAQQLENYTIPDGADPDEYYDFLIEEIGLTPSEARFEVETRFGSEIRDAFYAGWRAGIEYRFASRIEVRYQYNYRYPFAVYKDNVKIFEFTDECFANMCAKQLRDDIASNAQRQYDTCWCGEELIDGVCPSCGARRHNN